MAFDFKKEEDVKDYLKNLEIQYKFGCHQEKNPEVCHLLGDFMEAVKKDYPTAAKVYKLACDEHNFAKSCYNYGSYMMLGRGVDKDNPLEAYRYYSKGCELGNPESCCNAGVLLTSSGEKFDFLKNINRGITLLAKGCELGDQHACYYLSGMYISGSPDKTLSKDMTQAAKYARLGCDLNNMFACSNLSLMYKKGDGVDQNAELSEQYKKKALDLQKQQSDDGLILNYQRGPNS